MFSSAADYRYPGPNSPGGSEPMTLGSPVSSPPKNGHANMNYLPAILIRESANHSSPISPPRGSWSSPAPKQSLHGSFLQNQLSPVSARKTMYQSPAQNSMSHALNSPSIVKPMGPPVQGLFDSISSPRGEGAKFMKMDGSSRTPLAAGVGTPSSSFRYQESPRMVNVMTPNRLFSHDNSSYLSPAQIDPFYTQGESLTPNTQLDETWVTIFGFPPASINFILQQFSHYGKIVERKTETPGNWIHVRYQSKLQAKKALSKHGKIYSNIMVGVKPCIEMELMNESTKENTDVDVTSTDLSQDVLSIEDLDSSRRSLRKIRPLTQIYSSPNAETEGASNPKVQPKANSLVSKAIEYVLKW